jgi:hypothetical protein
MNILGQLPAILRPNTKHVIGVDAWQLMRAVDDIEAKGRCYSAPVETYQPYYSFFVFPVPLTWLPFPLNNKEQQLRTGAFELWCDAYDLVGDLQSDRIRVYCRISPLEDRGMLWRIK